MIAGIAVFHWHFQHQICPLCQVMMTVCRTQICPCCNSMLMALFLKRNERKSHLCTVWANLILWEQVGFRFFLKVSWSFVRIMGRLFHSLGAALENDRLGHRGDMRHNWAAILFQSFLCDTKFSVYNAILAGSALDNAFTTSWLVAALRKIAAE